MAEEGVPQQRDDELQEGDHHDENADTGMNRFPPSLHSLLWSYLLEPSTDLVASSTDLKTVHSFMLVNRASLAAFHECNGWSKVAENLKKEAIAKKESISFNFHCKGAVNEQEEAHDFVLGLEFPFSAATRKKMRALEARIVRIHQVLFIEACLLSMKYDGSLHVPSRQGFTYDVGVFFSVLDFVQEQNA